MKRTIASIVTVGTLALMLYVHIGTPQQRSKWCAANTQWPVGNEGYLLMNEAGSPKTSFCNAIGM